MPGSAWSRDAATTQQCPVNVGGIGLKANTDLGCEAKGGVSDLNRNQPFAPAFGFSSTRSWEAGAFYIMHRGNLDFELLRLVYLEIVRHQRLQALLCLRLPRVTQHSDQSARIALVPAKRLIDGSCDPSRRRVIRVQAQRLLEIGERAATEGDPTESGARTPRWRPARNSLSEQRRRYYQLTNSLRWSRQGYSFRLHLLSRTSIVIT